MEQADVPAAAEGVEELQQGAGTFRELEAADTLRRGPGGAAADHVANVQLRHLVSREIGRLVTELAQLRGQRFSLAVRPCGHADENLRPLAPAQPVVEFGHDPRAERGAERTERARALGDRHRE